MNDYICPNGHKFQSKAAIRAFCPECGESVKRTRVTSVPDTGDDKSDKAGDKSDGNAEGEKSDANKEPEKEPPKKKEPVRTKVIRVKRKEPDEIVAKKGSKKDEVVDDKDTGRSKLIKRRRIRQKYRHPTVKGKVKTNKETQDEKMQGKQRLTHWEIFRKRAGFGG